jgi:branched-chain amino acid transport system ATP-binding protein
MLMPGRADGAGEVGRQPPRRFDDGAPAPTILALKHEGLSILLSEQNIVFTRLVSHRACLIEKGQVRWQKSMQELAADIDVQRAFLAL